MKTLTIIILLALAAPAQAVGIVALFPTDTAGFIGMASQGPLDTPVLCTSLGEFNTTFGASTTGLSNPYLAPSVAGFFANGGTQCMIVRVAADDDASVIGSDLGPGARTGLQAFLDEPHVSMIAAPGLTSPSVQAALIAHCQTMGDRIAILDPASPDDLVAVQAQRSVLASDEGFAALYFPWVQAAPAGTSLLLPPSGFVAGWYSASDAPDSPIGAIATATGVAYAVTDADQDILNPQGINAIRNLSGIRIWGARTLATNPEMKYVAVRRMTSVLYVSIYTSTQWVIFEPNDYPVWAQFEQSVEDFLQERFLDGWFQGTTSDDAYFAQCGLNLTMTQEDINEGRIILQYGFAPVRPAEFLIDQVTHHMPVSAAPPMASAGSILHPAAPNPFNPRTTLRYTLAEDSRVNLHIYDAAGRLVRTVISDGLQPAGENQTTWNGRDDTGRAVASGVYLVKLQSGKEVETQRILLAR